MYLKQLDLLQMELGNYLVEELIIFKVYKIR